MRRKIVAGNWKMNGSLQFAKKLMEDLSLISGELKGLVDVVVAPPFVFLSDVVKNKGSEIGVASQNVSSFESGAFTGEISAEMLAEIGCQYCIVGHSERRALFGETDQVVSKKIEKLLEKNITPILCVGETLEQRDAGEALDIIRSQLDIALRDLNNQQLERVVVAYEPVWAIGTGKTATPEQAQSVHGFIREELAVKSKLVAELMPIIYGGSVNATNAKELFSMADIDGGLIGGASLKFEDFAEICRAIG